MTDQEILDLMALNITRYEKGKDSLYEEYLKMNRFINDLHKKNATHRHFKTRREMKEYMMRDFNPFNTFSYGKKKFFPTTSPINEES